MRKVNDGKSRGAIEKENRLGFLSVVKGYPSIVS